MPTVIDSLVVEFGLDPTKFTEGRKKAAEDLQQTKKDAERIAKDVEESGKQAARFFSQLKVAAVELFAAFTAGKGIKEFIADTVSAGFSLGRLSTILGTTIKDLSTWQGVAEVTGGSAKAITAVMAGLTSQVQKFSLTGEAGPFLTYWRGSVASCSPKWSRRSPPR